MQAWAFPAPSSDSAVEPLWWAPSPLEGVVGHTGGTRTLVGPSTAALPAARTASDSLSPETRSPREPKRRTRSGCKACRERRVKCEEGAVGADGTKAACRKCVLRKTECLYPATKRGRERDWATPAPRPQSERLEVSVVKADDVPQPPVFPSFAVALRPPPSQLAHPEYAVLETLAAGGDPARFIGSLSATSPSHDHFRSCMVPFLTRQFACTSTSTALYKPTDELTALYHAAVRIGYVSRLDGLEQAENHRLQAEEACQRAVSRRCRSEVLLCNCTSSPRARQPSQRSPPRRPARSPRRRHHHPPRPPNLRHPLRLPDASRSHRRHKANHDARPARGRFVPRVDVRRCEELVGLGGQDD
ncbi:hypothetical protein AAT19DRAFT_11369 [Rhodotorula toruloides]|uniref:Zn(2)-C6 fungal-type domain-containing protein n=1 Tax=Rhodotorula toruloides TaxID=5286 RepID=A0A2S9ZWK1_RHOTO|nr:hypothetical protein AAT19DRAFT_11369 [Rhodotorula toruloides]